MFDSVELVLVTDTGLPSGDCQVKVIGREPA